MTTKLFELSFLLLLPPTIIGDRWDVIRDFKKSFQTNIAEPFRQTLVGLNDQILKLLTDNAPLLLRNFPTRLSSSDDQNSSNDDGLLICVEPILDQLIFLMNKSFTGCEIISLQLAEKVESSSIFYARNEERMMEMNASLAQIQEQKKSTDFGQDMMLRKQKYEDEIRLHLVASRQLAVSKEKLDAAKSCILSNQQNLTGVLEVSPDWNFKKKIRLTLLKIINSPCYVTNFFKIRRAKNEYRTALKLFEDVLKRVQEAYVTSHPLLQEETVLTENMERVARELNSTRDTIVAYNRAKHLVDAFGQKLSSIRQLFESFRSILRNRIFYDDLPDILKLVEKLIPQLQAASNFELTFPTGDFMPKNFQSLYKMDLVALIRSFDSLKNFLSKNLVTSRS